MSFTVAQIQQQNKVFEQAYRTGKITSAQYQLAMRTQSANLKAAQAREATQQTQTLPKSSYWTAMPSPEQPSVSPVTEAQLIAAGGIKITPPSGYIVTNIKPTVVELEGPIAPGKTKADMMAEAISYELQERPKLVQQSDLSIGAQTKIALDVGLKLLEGYTKDNPIAKAEIQYGLAPIGNIGVGAFSTIEKRSYETVALAGSAYKSIKENKLQYAPGFEGFNAGIKTPKFAPTGVDAVVGQILGDDSEAKRLQSMPNAYFYQMGSALGEASFLTVTSIGEGAAIGRTARYVKTVVNPKVDLFAEKALGKSKLLVEAGLNKIEPGLGKASTLVAKSRATQIGGKLDLAEAKIANSLIKNVVNPVKYGKATNAALNSLVSTKQKAVTLGQRGLDLAMPQGSSESALFMRNIVKPNLTNYSKVLKPTAKMYSDDIIRTTGPALNNLKTATAPLTQAGKKALFTAKEPFIYSKSVAVPQARAKILTSTSSVVSLSKNTILQAKQPIMLFKNVKAPTQIAKASKAIQPVTRALTTQKSVLLTEVKAITKTSPVQTAKAIGKVTAGTARYSLKIATPKQAIVRTPLKFDVPATSVKTQQQLKQVLRQPQQTKKQSTMTVGMPKIIQPYPGTSKRIRESEETVYLTMPGDTLQLEKKSITTISLTRELGASQLSRLQQRGTTKTVSTAIQRSEVSTRVATDTRSADVQLKRVLQTQKVRVSQLPKTSSKPPMFSVPKGLMGGGGIGRGGGLKTGRTYFKRHPIPSASQQLKQLGFSVGTKKRKSKSKSKRGKRKR